VKEEIIMALSDKTKAAEAGQAAPTKPVDAKASGKEAKASAFKDKGASLRRQMTEDQKAQEGSKSDKVAFVCALGDPNRKQSRVQGKANIDSYAVVGYKFKVLEDTTVPFAPLNEGCKNILDVAPATEKPVSAGTVVALNTVETAMFISRLEYAGKFTGEGTTVILSAKTSNDRPDPLPILMKKGEGSVKENMELIADMVGADGTNKGTPQIKDEFKESFGALYTKRTISRKGTGASRKAGEGQADIAAAFRSLYAGKAN
jgi:hypothetical protein